MTVNFLGLFFRTGKIFFGLTRSSCLSVRMTDNFSASFGKSAQVVVNPTTIRSQTSKQDIFMCHCPCIDEQDICISLSTIVQLQTSMIYVLMFMPKQARHLHVSLICSYTGETFAYVVIYAQIGEISSQVRYLHFILSKL